MNVQQRHAILRAAGYRFPETEHLVSTDDAREEAKERAEQRRFYAPKNASQTREDYRKQVYLFNAMIRDPIHAWQRDVLVENRGIGLTRYRFALSSFIAEPRPKLPDGCDALPSLTNLERLDTIALDMEAEQALRTPWPQTKQWEMAERGPSTLPRGGVVR